MNFGEKLMSRFITHDSRRPRVIMRRLFALSAMMPLMKRLIPYTIPLAVRNPPSWVLLSPRVASIAGIAVLKFFRRK